MKLLWVCQGVPQLSDGSLLIAYELAKFLSKSHEQDLIFLKPPQELVSPPSFFRKVIAIPFKEKKDKFNRLKNIVSLRPNLVSYYASREMKRKIYRLTENQRYDIIIILTMNMAQFVSRLPGVRKIILPHDAEHLIYRQILDRAAGAGDKIKAWLWWKKVCLYQKRVYPCFDSCLVVSERDRQGLLNLSDRIKARVLPSGVDTGFFKPTGRVGKNNIIFTGVMNTWSNIDAVIYFTDNIFPLIEKSFSDIKFYIVGKKPAAAVKKLGRGNIVVTGEVPDIRPYLEESAVFVAPFRIGTGLKHKILEAMAMGLPVVATPLGANGLDIEAGKNIMLAGNPEEFARSIIALLNDKTLRKTVVKGAQELVAERYNWDRVGQMMESVLEEVLKN